MALAAAVWGLCSSCLGQDLLQKPILHSSSSQHTCLRPIRYTKYAIQVFFVNYIISEKRGTKTSKTREIMKD